MKQSIPLNITSQGVLIPLAAIESWLEQGLEIVQTDEEIILRPKQANPSPEQVLQNLEQTGIILAPEAQETDFQVLSVAEKQHLAAKLSTEQSLSEVVIAHRDRQL